MGGRCVRLVQGAFDASTAYGDDPVEIAQSFESQGVRRLHVVDLDGARTGSPRHLELLRSIKDHTDLTVDFGGGIRSRSTAERAFEAGADILSVGSTAIKQPDELRDWVSSFGSDRFIFAADIKGNHVTVSGWTQTTETQIEDAIDAVMSIGVNAVLATDVAVDGTMEGPAVSLYSRLRQRFPDLYLIASGGVGTEEDIYALEPTGVDAVIVGKAIYEGRVRLSEFV